MNAWLSADFGLSRTLAKVICLAALFGIGTIVFEFLTGGIPLGWAALIGALPFAFAADTPPERIVRAVLSGLTAYSTAIAACSTQAASRSPAFTPRAPPSAASMAARIPVMSAG